jgi:hypothetical protein
MLEAANARPRFHHQLKRSTQNLQLSTSRRPITPSFGRKADIVLLVGLPTVISIPDITDEYGAQAFSSGRSFDPADELPM